MTLSIRHIRYFIAAAETGQISRAAIELGISQSAVTAAVKQIESEVGAKLLERHAHGVTLTLEGSRFLRHARTIMASMSAALRLETPRASDEKGEVRVGVTYTVAGYFLPQYLTRFNRAHPHVTVKLNEAPRAAIEDDLVAGRLDTAVILTANIEDRENLNREALIRSRRRLWTAADHPLQAAQSVALAEIANEPYVMLTVDEAERTAERYWRAARCQPRVIFRTSSVEAVRSMVASGTGVTILSDMVYRPWSLDGQRIETRLVADPIASMDVGLAWVRGRALPGPARAFNEFMSLTFNGGAHALSEVSRRPRAG
ncbi:MAG: LysR family transcriptional regulator [Devosia sp.]